MPFYNHLTFVNQQLLMNFEKGKSNECTKYAITKVVGTCSASKSKEIEVEERSITVSLIFSIIMHEVQVNSDPHLKTVELVLKQNIHKKSNLYIA